MGFITNRLSLKSGHRVKRQTQVPQPLRSCLLRNGRLLPSLLPSEEEEEVLAALLPLQQPFPPQQQQRSSRSFLLGMPPNMIDEMSKKSAQMASPLEVASTALGFEGIPKVQDTNAENNTVLEIDKCVSAPNRYTKYQVAVLSSAYSMCTKPSRSQHKRLSDSVGLTERQSKIWFQNKRQRQRNAISMSQNDSLKEEITEMAENLQDIKYRSNILEIENQYLNSDLKKKTAQLEELQNLKYLLFDIKKTSCIAATS